MEPRYQHQIIGGNFRLDEIQAAILDVKLPHLEDWSARRRAAADFYRDEFTGAGLTDRVTLPLEPYREHGLINHHIYHQYVIRTSQRDAVREHLAETAPGAIPVVQEQQNGTGHAVRVALDAVPSGETGTVVVVPGDAPLLATATLRALVDEHETSGAAATVLSSIAPDPSGYGRVIRADDGKSVQRVVEHKDATAAERAITEVAARYLALKYGLLTAHEIAKEGAYPSEQKGVELVLSEIMKRSGGSRDDALDLLLAAYLTGNQEGMRKVFGAAPWAAVIELGQSDEGWQTHRISKALAKTGDPGGSQQ